MRAARAGKHMVLGKPMAMTVAQADEMVAAVETSGVVVRSVSGDRSAARSGLKARIDKGEIGDLVVLHQTGRWSIAEDWYSSGTPGWFVDPRQVPGGAFIDEGIYWIDVFRWLAGSEVVEVDARMGNIVHKDIAVEDWGFATFTFANGIIATLEASWTINAPTKTGPSPKHNLWCGSRWSARAARSSSSVPRAGPRGARGRRRRLGLRAARSRRSARRRRSR